MHLSKLLYLPGIAALTWIIAFSLLLSLSPNPEEIRTSPLVIALIFVPIVCGLSLIEQFKYFKRNKYKTELKHQFCLGASIALVPTIILILADLAGASDFNTPLEYANNILIIGGSLLISSAIAITVLTISNSMLFATKFHKLAIYLYNGFRVLAWFVLAVAAFMIMSIVHSLHDPSTE